jgi:hypothetical protein
MVNDFINSKQSKEQRRTKYNFCIDCGLNYKEAMRLRDWTNRHIVIFLYGNKENIMTKYKKEK